MSHPPASFAFSLQETAVNDRQRGLTKQEYAAIHIAAALAPLAQNMHWQPGVLAARAVELANEVLDACD